MTGFIPLSLASQIAEHFYRVDQQVRRDLSSGRVVGERDYLSRLVTLLEYPYGIKGKGKLPFKHLFVANNFPGAIEQQFGCDTLFVFRYGNKVKMLAIEGKYPRFEQPNYGWDQLQKKGKGTKVSHFEDQIARQSRISSAIPVLEMFLESEPPNYRRNDPYHRDNLGSSLVTHQVANRYSIPKRTWKQRDALNIIQEQYKRTGNISISYFIGELLQCSIGRPYKINQDTNSVNIRTKDNQKVDTEINLPRGKLKKMVTNPNIPIGNLLKDLNDKKYIKLVRTFMDEVGLKQFGLIHVI